MYREVKGSVLDKKTSASAYERIYLLTQDVGLLVCMYRKGTKQKGLVALDIFDEVEVVLREREGADTFFIQECRVISRQDWIGKDYEALMGVSELARFFSRNKFHEENSRAYYAIWEKSLVYMQHGIFSDAVILKAYIKVLKMEGYGVKEEWLVHLTEAEQAVVLRLISGVFGAVVLGAEDIELIPGIKESIKAWAKDWLG